MCHDVDIREVPGKPLRAVVIELPVHQPARPLQQGHPHTEVMQRIRGLHAQHATADHDRLAGGILLRPHPHSLGIVGAAQNEGVAEPGIVRAGNESVGASGEHESVIGKHLARPQA